MTSMIEEWEAEIQHSQARSTSKTLDKNTAEGAVAAAAIASHLQESWHAHTVAMAHRKDIELKYHNKYGKDSGKRKEQFVFLLSNKDLVRGVKKRDPAVDQFLAGLSSTVLSFMRLVVTPASAFPNPVPPPVHEPIPDWKEIAKHGSTLGHVNALLSKHRQRDKGRGSNNRKEHRRARLSRLHRRRRRLEGRSDRTQSRGPSTLFGASEEILQAEEVYH